MDKFKKQVESILNYEEASYSTEESIIEGLAMSLNKLDDDEKYDIITVDKKSNNIAAYINHD